MGALTFREVEPGTGKYEVARNGVVLGTVEPGRSKHTKRNSPTAFRTHWTYTRINMPPSSVPFATRKAAADALDQLTRGTPAQGALSEETRAELRRMLATYESAKTYTEQEEAGLNLLTALTDGPLRVLLDERDHLTTDEFAAIQRVSEVEALKRENEALRAGYGVMHRVIEPARAYALAGLVHIRVAASIDGRGWDAAATPVESMALEAALKIVKNGKREE